jgi:hypothetical protein
MSHTETQTEFFVFLATPAGSTPDHKSSPHSLVTVMFSFLDLIHSVNHRFLVVFGKYQ